MLLAIETSSLVSSVALLHEQTLRAELTIQARLTHSEQLMPHIADMLEKASVPKTAIDAVAVSIGPGSFTGLRIGMASAKGLSFGWNVPLIGIETPTALAWNFIGAKDPVCVLIDAQKGNVYMSLYEWQGMHLQELEPVQVAPLTEVLAQLATLGKAVVFCGDGSLLGRTQIEAASPQFRLAPPTMVIPRAGSLALAADERYSRQDVDDRMTLTPAYKRRSEAEVLWEKRHGRALCL